MWGKQAALAATMCASGCLLADANGADPKEPPKPTEQWIAVGAQVELRLTECSGDGRLLHCLPTRIAELEKLEVDDSFELVDTRAENGEAYAVLFAKTVGDAVLRIAYVDESEIRHMSEVSLHAVEPGSVGVSADCGDGPMLRPELYLGVDSTVNVTLDPRTKGRDVLETGELALFDFGAFEVLEQAGTRVTLRAPTKPGPYVWSSIARERFEVSVYDASSIALMATSARGPSTTLRLAPDPGGLACTSAPGAVAQVRVAQGDCQLGFAGVRISGALPLSLVTAGAELEVTGQGECTLSVQVHGDTVAEHTLNLHSPAPAAPSGRPIGTTPLRFELQEPLPTASCDQGVTDGECEPLVWLIPDADCITDADFRMEHFDSRGPIGDDYVGTGLVTSVELGVVVGSGLVEGMRAPMDVTWSYDERLFGLLASADEVHVEIGECIAPQGETRVAKIRVDAVGPHQIEFEASNLNDTGELDFAARDVDRGRIEAFVEGSTVSEREWPVFAGSSVSVSAHYERSDGLVLRGDAPIEAVSNVAESGARIGSLGALFVGDVPSTLELTPTVGSGGQRLLVVGEESVAELQVTSKPETVLLGEGICVEASALDATGRIIRGGATVPLTAELAGDEPAWVLDPSTTPRSLCLRSVASAPNTLTLSMGAASVVVVLPIPEGA